MKRFISGLFIHILIIVCCSAQNFKGKVTDESGQPVAHAALYLKEIQSGFTTDDNGVFRSKLPAGSYTCEVSSLGFASHTFSFRMSGSDYEKNIVLAERTYTLPEVAVRKGDEDPAYAIMRQAIARAPFHRTQVKNFSAGTYLKGTGKGTSIPAVLKLSKEVRKTSKEVLDKLFVLEEQQVVNFIAPNKWDIRVLASKSSFPDEMQVTMGLTAVNLYHDELFGKVSPLRKNAFSFYRFKIEGCFVEGGQMINKIRVIPRKDDVRLLSGYLFVVEDLWCISAAEVDLRGMGMKAKIKVNCSEVQPSVYMPTSNTMTSSIDLMGFKAEASYLAAIHYSKVNTGAPSLAHADTTGSVPPQLVRKRKYERPARVGRADTQVDSLAGKRDSLYWETVRSVPLRREELQSYQGKTIKIQPSDSLATRQQKKENTAAKTLDLLLGRKTFQTAHKKAWLKLPSMTSYVPDYNFVDGFWVGLTLQAGVQLSSASSLRFVPSLYYATARHCWMGEGELQLEYAPLRSGRLSVSGGMLSADYNGESGESRLVNAMSTSLFGHNHLKLYEKTFFTVEHAIEPFNGLLFTSSLSWQRRQMLDNHIEKSWFGRTAEPNLPEHPAFVFMPRNELLKASFALQYTPAHYYHIAGGRKVYEAPRYPTFTLMYDRAFPMSGGNYLSSYHLLQVSARQEMNFGLFHRLHWSVNGGTFLQARQLQFVDFKHFASTRIALTERSFDDGFSLMDNYRLSTGKRWAQGNVSWYAPYLLLKHLPFLSRKLFDEALHLRSVAMAGQRLYTEAGYSLGFSTMARVGGFVGFEGTKLRSVGISCSLSLSMLGVD